jgi:hypothetical protein
MRTLEIRSGRDLRCFALALFCGSGLASAASAQDPQPPVPVPIGGQEEDAKQKMIRLFGEVQKHLDEVDRLLLEASSKRSAEEITAAVRKMDELLREAEKNQASTIEKIDEIIRSAPQQQGSGKGKSKKPQQPQQNQGQPQEPQQPNPGEQGQRDQRSDSPQQLDSSQKGERPQGERPQGEQPGGEQPKEGRQQPESNRSSDEEGQNLGGPESARKEGIQRGDPRGNWEVQLPRKQTEVFRNPLRDTQIPDRYHRWIERWRSRGAGGERRNG